MTQSSLNKCRLMLIEDDVDTQELVTAFMRQQNYEITCFGSAEEALESLKQGKQHYDVIISDLNLPDMSGIEFISAVKTNHMETPIIIMTAQKGVETAVAAIEAGAYDFVVKPLHFPQLLVSIQRASHLTHMKQENSVLKMAIQMKEPKSASGLIAKSEKFKQVIDLATRVAKSKANIFIHGESGTGKEVIAKLIHSTGVGDKKPFIAINCSAIPENLLESELFGHAKGSFTGAVDKKIGLFEEAEGGTLFLDEIGDLSLPLQAKLLRVLQERKIKRIGENSYRDIDVRIISATHKDLRKEVSEKHFREDLFFRLNVIPIVIPPLRDRKEDIIPMADFFLKKYAALNSSSVKSFSKESLDHMLNMKWPGNVRELENAVERAVILCLGNQIEVRDLSSTMFDTSLMSGSSINPTVAPENQVMNGALSGFQFAEEVNSSGPVTLDQLQKKYIRYVLEKNQGARDKTAKELDIDRKTLYRKIQEIEKDYDIKID